jgi:peptidoglycan glycosyltransferase
VISRIRLLGAALMVLYAVLFVQLNRVQLFGAERLQDHAENTRGLVREFGRQRGDIVTADGVVVAMSVPYSEEIDYRRVYPEGDLYAHVTGYQSLNVAATGLERAYNDELAGRTIEQQFRSLSDLFRDRDTSADLVLTIRDDVQRVAREALGELRGSVVALDPRTGAVIALWSYPSFDPNPIASPDGAEANAAYEEVLTQPGNPLLAKAFREVYFPGSTFKLVTGSAGVSSGLIGEADPVFPVSDAYEPIPAGTPIRNFGGSSCGGDFREILRVSCNTAFAEMGAEWVGPELMIDVAEDFGFNSAPPFDVPGMAESRFPTEYGSRLADVSFYRAPDLVDEGPGDEEAGGRAVVLPNGDVDVYEDSARLAQASIGQNDVAATPLQMALVAAAIANDGVIMTPHVVAERRAADGSVYDRTEPTEWRRAIEPHVAAVLHSGMLDVAANGTARNLLVPGYEVGGKTGTAQLGTEVPRSHAWIVGFAGPPGEPAEIAVAVLVEAQEGADEQTGGRVAAPIARQVLEAALAGP